MQPNEKFIAALMQILRQLEVLADQLSMDGRLLESGVVLTAKQTIRALWSQIAAKDPPVDSPAEPPVPSEPTPMPEAPVPTPEAPAPAQEVS